MKHRKNIYIKKEEAANLGPAVREGEHVFGVAHIFASFNDAFIHVTDLSRRETMVRIIGGMKVKTNMDESSPYSVTPATQDASQRCKELGISYSFLACLVGNRRPTKAFRIPILNDKNSF